MKTQIYGSAPDAGEGRRQISIGGGFRSTVGFVRGTKPGPRAGEIGTKEKKNTREPHATGLWAPRVSLCRRNYVFGPAPHPL